MNFDRLRALEVVPQTGEQEEGFVLSVDAGSMPPEYLPEECMFTTILCWTSNSAGCLLCLSKFSSLGSVIVALLGPSGLVLFLLFVACFELGRPDGGSRTTNGMPPTLDTT